METFADDNSTSVDSDSITSFWNLTGLRLGTEYQFTIVAYTKVGPGPEAMMSVSTLPDGNYNHAYSTDCKQIRVKACLKTL